MDKIARIMDLPGVDAKLIRISEHHMRGGFCVTVFPDRNLFWSSGVFDLLEIDHDVLPSNETFSRMIHPDDRRSAAEIESSIASAMPYGRKFRLITAKKTMKWVLSHNEFIIDSSGTTNYLISSLMDVTADHQSAQALEINRLRFKALASSIASVAPVSWTARHDGYVEYLNGWEKLTGQPDHESEGWGWLDCVHPDDREAFRALWERNLLAERMHEGEFRICLKDGSWMWMTTRALPVKDFNNKVIEWVGSATTIQSQRVWVVDADDSMDISGAQLRAARGLLNWSVTKLSSESGVSCSAIRRLEEFNGVTKNGIESLRPLKRSLEAGGVEFIFPPNGKSGVRPR